MDRIIKSRWIEALRSGEYKQAEGKLCDDSDNKGGPKFCCLGVLTDLYLKYNDKQWYETDSWGAMFISNEVLPIEVKNWAGLYSKDPVVDDENHSSTCLSAMNDDGRTFTEIADILSSQDPE